jgi:hypothetical protein
MQSLTAVTFFSTFFVILYGLILAIINLDDWNQRTHTERAVGFYSIFSILLILSLIFYIMSGGPVGSK